MCFQPGKIAQFFMAFMLMVVGLILSFSLGCTNGRDLQIALAWYLVSANVVSFFAFACDKLQAMRDGWRFAEIALYLLMFSGGMLGGWLAMGCCKHKTSKCNFLTIAGTVTIINLAWVIIALIITARSSMPMCYK